MSETVLGILGGSGLYAIDGLEDVREETIETPWGMPSGPLVRGQLAGVDLVFLARHGAGHAIPPGEVNYRANIAAMKHGGVTDILSISACGSFREELSPGTFVIVDQFIDRTKGRAQSFFEKGLVAHVSMADPVCPRLGDEVARSLSALGIPHHRGATYLAMEGPQFSTRAESHLYRSWGCDVVGMTNMPEARLAREAELPYATVAMVTDYDCWRQHEDAVDVASVIEIMNQNSANGRRLIADVAPRLGPARTACPMAVETCLDHALITAPAQRDPAVVEKLRFIAARALGQSDK